MNATHKTIYTIGYAPHTLETFLETLKVHQVSAVVDVRSSPYSQYKPEFNRETLKDYLKANQIAYVFLGDYCGARVEDPSCYVNGKVDYRLVAENQKFKEGLDRIKKGMENFSIALMCAEKDPITCHRTILICRNLISSEIKIKHILSDGSVEEHKDSENRLLKIFKLNHPDLFRSEQQRLDDAYSRQGEKIAYETAEPAADYEEQ
jgi:uncharacterized protein (DUF488 family)